MADVEAGQEVVEAATPARAPGTKLRKLRSRYKLTTSGLVKDGAVAGVTFVALKVTYMYLKAFGQRPDLLAGLGTKLIVDILLITLVAVIVNRAVDIFGSVLDRSADSLDRALNRVADSSEQTARSAAEAALAQQATALAQQQIATSQQQMALAQRDQTAVMQRVAENGDTTLTQVQTVQNYQVSQSRIMRQEMRRSQQFTAAIAQHLGVAIPQESEEKSHE